MLNDLHFSEAVYGFGAAAGIELINSSGNLAGFVNPAVVGWLREHTTR